MSGVNQEKTAKDIVWLSSLIVVATPEQNEQVKSKKISDTSNEYTWTIQKFKVDEVLLNRSSSYDIEGETIAVSSFDSHRFDIAVRRSQNVNLIEIYQTYKRHDPIEISPSSKRILILKDNMQKDDAPFVYSMTRSIESINALSYIMQLIKGDASESV